MATQRAVKWNMKGSIVLACNCDYGCPCNFNAKPTQGHCEGGWVWRVDNGRYGDSDLAGLSFALLGDWPKAIHEGNGEALLLVDSKANNTQREALSTLLMGRAGGPWGILANTITKYHGPEYVPFQVTLNGTASVVRAGKVLEMELEPIRNPVSKAEAHPKVVLPQGFVFKEASLCANKSFKVDSGVKYGHPGKYGAFAPFDYTGP